MKERKYFLVLAIIIFFFNYASIIVFAADNNINILTPISGQNFNVGEPVTVSGEVNLLSGDADPTKYGVTIDWNDTTITDCLTLSGTSNPYSYTTSPSNNHPYSSGGSKTIKVMLFHQCAQGKDPSKADATASVNIAIVTTTTTVPPTTTTLPTCDISVKPDIDFETMIPGETSGDQEVTITNSGTVPTTSLTIEGTDWSDGGSNTMPVTQTHWSLTPLEDYNTMNDLNLSPESVGTNVSPGSPVEIFFKLRIPAGQTPSSYTQIITFTGSC